MSWYDFDWGGNGDSSSNNSGSDSSSPSSSSGSAWNSLGSGMNSMTNSDLSSGSNSWLPSATGSGSSSSTSGLGSLFNTVKDGINAFNNAGGGLLVKGGLAAYDAYQKNKTAGQLQNQMNTLSGMYAPGTPEATAMQQQMDATDAAAGRRSQYGTRATQLAAQLSQQRSNILNSPNYLNLASAQAAQSQGAYKSIADLFGQISKSNFADGGLVGGSGDDSDIQWKGTDSDFNPKDLTWLSQPTAFSNGSQPGTTPLFSKSWSFDDGAKQTPDVKPVPDDYAGMPSDEQLQQMGSDAGFTPQNDSTAIANTLTGQGDGQLADFWSNPQSGSAPSFDANALSQPAIDSWNSGYSGVADAYNKQASILAQTNAAVNNLSPAWLQQTKMNNYVNAADAYNSYLQSAPKGITNVPTAISDPMGLWNSMTSSSFGSSPTIPYAGAYTPTTLGSTNYAGGASPAGYTPSSGNLFNSAAGGAGGSNFSLSQPSFSWSGSYANGGLIPGHDLNGTDDVKANLTKGEFVLPTHVVDAIGADKLQSLVDMFAHRKGR